jgi:glycosyltransferase involved in cell wall biosynthesis
MLGFSIVICTYNPKEKIFSRLLMALERLDKSLLEYEIIIVDNNSSTAFCISDYFLNFLNQQPLARLIVENNPGLTSARIAGINASKFDWLVFFDDDNEPASNYLVKAAEAISGFPQTAAWGAAEVKVEYLGSPEQWVYEEKELFQQRNGLTTVISDQELWQECYPYGTGLIVKKEIGLLYAKRVIESRYTLTDRKGKSLSSGGDIQLILTGIEQGFSAGIIGGLRIGHLIDISKSTLSYMQKLQYGTASAYLKAHNQVFIESQIQIERITNGRVLLLFYGLLRIYKPRTTKQRFRLLLASKMGELNARTEFPHVGKPFLLRFYEKIIGV